MLVAETVDRGSATGWIACEPWQSGHLATRVKPSDVTLPWNVSREVFSGSSWQVPHSRITSSCQGAASVRRIWCAEWQSVQTGARWLPFATARPCTDCAYSACTPAWHVPQVAGTFARNTREVGSVRGLISCAPWQSEQLAATRRPLLLTSRPWIESM